MEISHTTGAESRVGGVDITIGRGCGRGSGHRGGAIGTNQMKGEKYNQRKRGRLVQLGKRELWAGENYSRVTRGEKPADAPMELAGTGRGGREREGGMGEKKKGEV